MATETIKTTISPSKLMVSKSNINAGYSFATNNYMAMVILLYKGDFMFFISLPQLILLPTFFTIINNKLIFYGIFISAHIHVLLLVFQITM